MDANHPTFGATSGNEEGIQQSQRATSPIHSPQPPVLIPDDLFSGLRALSGHPQADGGHEGFPNVVPWPPVDGPLQHTHGPTLSTARPYNTFPPGVIPPPLNTQPGEAYNSHPPRPWFTTPPIGFQYGSVPAEKFKNNRKTYTAVNPFRSGRNALSEKLPIAQGQGQVPHHVVYPYLRRRNLLPDFFFVTFTFLFNTLPRELYLLFLLHVPAFYFSRVARIFEEAKMTMPEIERMALDAVDLAALYRSLSFSDDKERCTNLKRTWELFIESLLREWKTLNIVSVLSLSAILTILQIESANADPIIRNCALLSLICALMSLVYGCMFIIRFSGMRKTYKALEWAQEAQKTGTVIWWNVWVLLAMPAAWLAWSLILHVTCIMAFVWRTGPGSMNTVLELSPRAELSIRIAISSVFTLGIIYLALILNTLRHYGESMDKKFGQDLDLWVNMKKQEQELQSFTHSTMHNHRPNEKPYKATKVMNLVFLRQGFTVSLPKLLVNNGFKQEDWDRFILEVTLAWDGNSSLSKRKRRTSEWRRPQDNVARVLEQWNQKYFTSHNTMGLLCQEYLELFPDSPVFSIYMVDYSSSDTPPKAINERFSPVPDGLTQIDIFNQPEHEGPRRTLGKTSIFALRSIGDRSEFSVGNWPPSWPSNQHRPPPLSPPRWTYAQPSNNLENRNIPPPWASVEPYQYPPTHYQPVDIAPELVNQYYRSSVSSSPSPDPTGLHPFHHLSLLEAEAVIQPGSTEHGNGDQIRTQSPDPHSSLLIFPPSVLPIISHADSPSTPPPKALQGATEKYTADADTSRHSSQSPRSRRRRIPHQSTSDSPELMAEQRPNLLGGGVQPLPLSQEVTSLNVMEGTHDENRRSSGSPALTMGYKIIPNGSYTTRDSSANNPGISGASDIALDDGDPWPQSIHLPLATYSTTESPPLLNRSFYLSQEYQHPDNPFVEQPAFYDDKALNRETAKGHAVDRPLARDLQTLPILPSQESLSER